MMHFLNSNFTEVVDMLKQTKLAFKPRHSKNEAPLGWTPTTMRGKPEWRCKEIQFVFKYNEYRRCSYCCEKKKTLKIIKNMFTISLKKKMKNSQSTY
ncbi:hypothetical protein M9Y10_016541 [Tritrichomonas musculus]|uniref:Uncharacterized protein n=1 Tax=Tritrichomonas musculus TaxID=1915356 RepID=A0ABR2HXF5_9EUKA